MRSIFLRLGISLGILSGCGHASSPPPAVPPAAVLPPSPLLTAVGPHPRGYVRIALADPMIREQLVAMVSAAGEVFRGSPATCHVDVGQLDRIQIAIGEPLRIAAAVDGKIDVAAVTCLLGAEVMAGLAQVGVVIRDRPGGLDVAYQAEPAATGPGGTLGAELASRCAGASCGAVMLGPANRRLWVQLGYAKVSRLELSGPSLGHGAEALVAAINGLRASTPALQRVVARAQAGTLVLEIPNETATSVALALTLRMNLIEAFKMPSSSMVPTLHVNDHVFVVKGPLAGSPAPGDVLVHNVEGRRQYVKRYLAGPGQTIAETGAGLSIDGTPLVTDVLDPDFHYSDVDEMTNQTVPRSGTLVREHLGARSYLTLRTGPPNKTGTWTVPAGHVFFVGDNRNNSNDSRYLGSSAADAIVGRVVGIWLAYHDGVPDWDRMGMPIE